VENGLKNGSAKRLMFNNLKNLIDIPTQAASALSILRNAYQFSMFIITFLLIVIHIYTSEKRQT